MKTLNHIWYLVIALVLNFSCGDAQTEKKDVQLVTAAEMQAILELEDAQLIDVRTPQEHQEIRIANSQNIDFLSPTFNNDILKLDKTKPVIIYCRSGARSAACAKKLKAAGFEKIYDLEGGISKWKNSDELEVEVKS